MVMLSHMMQKLFERSFLFVVVVIYVAVKRFMEFLEFKNLTITSTYIRFGLSLVSRDSVYYQIGRECVYGREN